MTHSLSDDAFLNIILHVKLIDLINLYLTDKSLRRVLDKPNTIKLLAEKYIQVVFGEFL